MIKQYGPHVRIVVGPPHAVQSFEYTRGWFYVCVAKTMEYAHAAAVKARQALMEGEQVQEQDDEV